MFNVGSSSYDGYIEIRRDDGNGGGGGDGGSSGDGK